MEKHWCRRSPALSSGLFLPFTATWGLQVSESEFSSSAKWQFVDWTEGPLQGLTQHQLPLLIHSGDSRCWLTLCQALVNGRASVPLSTWALRVGRTLMEEVGRNWMASEFALMAWIVLDVPVESFTGRISFAKVVWFG